MSSAIEFALTRPGRRWLLWSVLVGALLVAFAGSAQAATQSVVVLEGGFGSVGTPKDKGVDRAYVGGYVLQDQGNSDPGKRDSKPRNLGRSIRSLLAKPVSDAEVEIEVGGRRYLAKTDQSGHFSAEISAEHLRQLGEGSHSVSARVADQNRVELGKGHLQLFRYDQDIVISDIDDTAAPKMRAQPIRL
jgi:hypothetical protein